MGLGHLCLGVVLHSEIRTLSAALDESVRVSVTVYTHRLLQTDPGENGYFSHHSNQFVLTCMCM